MPKYKYKFCDGSTNEIEVSGEHHALLSAMDKREQMNERYHGRRNTSLDDYLRKEEKADSERDKDFKRANK